MAGACGVQVDGPLAPFAVGLEEALVAEGYSKQRTRLLIGFMAEVSHWLAAGGLQASDLTGEVVEEFFEERVPGRSRCRTARSLAADRGTPACDRRGADATEPHRWAH